MRQNTLLSLMALAVLSLTGRAEATVLTFDELEEAGSGLTSHGDTYEIDGFRFEDNLSVGFYHFQQGESRYDTTASLFNNSANGTTTLSAINGDLFSISSIDLDLLNLTSGTGFANVHFFAFDAGDNLIADLSTDLTVNGFNTLNFGSGFTGISYLEWDQSPAFHQFDNLVLNANPVPEPASMTLFGLGIAGLAYRRRKTA